MTTKLREVYHSTYYRHGASYGMTIPPDLREAMGLVPGDHFYLNFMEGVLWVVKVTPETVIPREKVSRIMNKLFPGKDTANGSDR